MVENRVKRIRREGVLAFGSHEGGIAALLAVSLGMLPGAPSFAQSYPTKAIRVIVPYPPGGTSDILTRLIAAKLTESWGQQIIADNRTGAGGNIGAELTARAAADGYTLMLTDIGNVVSNSILYSKLSFDFLRDFAPVTTVSYSPHLLAVHPSGDYLYAANENQDGTIGVLDVFDEDGKFVATESGRRIAGSETRLKSFCH